MKVKMKVPGFLREEVEFYMRQRMDYGVLLYTLAWGCKEETDRFNRRFRELSDKTRMTEEEKQELCLMIQKGWKQYVQLYHTGITYKMCIKYFSCKVIGNFWGRDPGAVYFDMKQEKAIDFVEL